MISQAIPELPHYWIERDIKENHEYIVEDISYHEESWFAGGTSYWFGYDEDLQLQFWKHKQKTVGFLIED